MAKQPKDERTLADEIADDAARNTLALNPLVGMRTEDLISAAGTVMRALAGQPQALAQQWLSFATEFGKIVTGQSELAADPKDRRFTDPAWKSSGVHKALMQSYMAWGKAVTDLVENTELPQKDAARARLVTSIFVDTMAPSNNPMLNPTAVKTFVDSGGKSAISGLKNFLDDMTKNGGLPSSVDVSKFKVGEIVINHRARIAPHAPYGIRPGITAQIQLLWTVRSRGDGRSTPLEASVGKRILYEKPVTRGILSSWHSRTQTSKRLKRRRKRYARRFSICSSQQVADTPRVLSAWRICLLHSIFIF